MKKITFILSLFFLLSCFLLPAEVLSAQCGAYEGVEEFDDVKSTNPYYDDICFARSKGWSGGVYSSNRYEPDEPLKRSHFAKMVTIAAWNPNVTSLKEAAKDDECYRRFKDGEYINIFNDIKDKYSEDERENLWYIERICYAKEKNIMIGNASESYQALPDKNISFQEALKMTMIAFLYNKECRKSEYSDWFDKYLYSIITNNIIDDFTASLEKSGDFGAVDRGYAAYLIKNIFDKQGDLNKCKDVTGTNVQVGISGANVRNSPYKRNDDKTTTDDESEFNKIDYINPYENVTVLRDEIKIRKSKDVDDFDKKWKLIDTGNRIGFIHSSTIGDNNITLGSLVFPFQNRSKDWEICQGYNTPKISHHTSLIYGLDFAYGIGHSEGNGCWWKKDASENQVVVAPSAGIIVKNARYPYTPELVCLQLNNGVSNGYGEEIHSIMLGHIADDGNRAEIDDEVLQWDSIGELCGANECEEDGGYSHLHISVYTSNNCSGISIPIGTVFGEGYDFSSNNRQRQWQRTMISSLAH